MKFGGQWLRYDQRRFYAGNNGLLGERISIDSHRYGEFRVEAFNVLNHPSFGAPNRDISAAASFGTITNTVSSPRVIELVFKFYF